MSRIEKWWVYASAGALFLQLLAFVASWLITATMPDTSYHSLLSSEGIRWFVGSIVENVANRFVIMLLLLAMAYGALKYGGMLHACGCLMKKEKLLYRQKYALRIACIIIPLLLAVVALLTFVPHAPLLGVTGSLYPSSFSKGLVPMFTAIAVAAAWTYAALAGNVKSIGEAFHMLTKGIADWAPAIMFLALLSQLVASVMFIMK